MTHRVRESQIVKNMYKFEENRVAADLATEQERHCVVQRNTFCRVCDKRLGDSVIVIQPDNTPIHFSCDHSSQEASGSGSGTPALTAGRSGFLQPTSSRYALPAAGGAGGT